MKSLQSLIEGLAYNESHVICYRDEIWLEFENYTLVLHYDCPEEGVFPDTEFFELKDIKTSDLFIDEVWLSNGTNAAEESYVENEISYSASMYAFVRQIQRRFPDAMDGCVVDSYYLDDGDLYGCPENVEYCYRITLRREFWENDANLQALVTVDWNAELNYHPYYLPLSKVQVTDDCHFDFLGTNTKVRRLGYLGILLSLFEGSPSIAKKNLGRLLEQKAQENQNALTAYKNPKGAITPSKTGVSATPYIRLALEIGVIREMTGHYELGKMGRVYLETRKVVQERQTNPFELTTFEKVFWLERLLESDYVYLHTLLEYAFLATTPSYADLRKKFDGLVLDALEKLHSSAYETLTKMALRNAIQRIKGWKKPEIYLEHILMPRLNWLYDLGLLELRKDLTFELTKEARLLFFNLAEWRDLRRADVCNPATYLDAYYMHIVNDIFYGGQGENCDNAEEVLEKTLTYSFEHFRTMAPNRVTYSVYQAFAKYTLLLGNAMVIEATDIKDRYLPSVADRYVFMFQRYYNDGFIQKK